MSGAACHAQDCSRTRWRSPTLPDLCRSGVRVAPSTDDEGIERIDLTHEYVRAVETCDFAYADRMEIVRNSLEYSFLPGARLWASPDFARVASACQNDLIVTEKPSEPRQRSNGNLSGGLPLSRRVSRIARMLAAFELKQRSCDFLRAKTGKWVAQ